MVLKCKSYFTYVFSRIARFPFFLNLLLCYMYVAYIAQCPPIYLWEDDLDRLFVLELSV